MSDYSPMKLRQMWEDFQAYAAKGRREGLSIYLDNTRSVEQADMYSTARLIHTTGEELDLKISRTIQY